MIHDTESERGLPELPQAAYSLDLHDGHPVFAYSAQQMYNFGNAAIEKDRAERSEAVPVGYDIDPKETVGELAKRVGAWETPEGFVSFGSWMAVAAFHHYTLKGAASAFQQMEAARAELTKAAPPERSDVQGAEMAALQKCEDVAIASGAYESYATVRDAFAQLSAALASRPAVQQEGMTDEQILKVADQWFKTGENQHFRDGYRYRSLGVPSNVTGSDLIAFARAMIAAAPPASACAKDDK